MPEIKIPTSDQMERSIQAVTAFELLDESFTATSAGIHSFGASVGRGNGQILDVRSASELTVIASSSKPLDNEQQVVVVLYDENGRLAGQGSGTTPAEDPAAISVATAPLTEAGTVKIDSSDVTRHTLDVRRAIGAIVFFQRAPEEAELRVRILAHQHDSQLERIRDENDTHTVNLVNAELASTQGGAHIFGATVGRGNQEILDVRRYSTLHLKARVESEVPVRGYVLLFDESGRLNTSLSSDNDPGIIERIGEVRLGYGDEHHDSVDVSRAHGALFVFHNLHEGAIGKVQLSGSVTPSQTAPTLRKIYHQKLKHEDLYTAEGDPKNDTTALDYVREYRRILFYVISDFPVPIRIRAMEYEGGAIQQNGWDGEGFSVQADDAVIPAVSTIGGSRRKYRFPIHQAIRAIQDGLFWLYIRISPEEESPAADGGGEPYLLEIMIFGEK